MRPLQPLVSTKSFFDDMSRLDDQFIFKSGIDSPTEFHEVVERERDKIEKLITEITEGRRSLGLPQYSPERLQVSLARWTSIIYHHRKQQRDTGEFYSTHLFNTAHIASNISSFDLDTVDLAVAHDVIEDINPRSVFFTTFYPDAIQTNQKTTAIDSPETNTTHYTYTDEDLRLIENIKALSKPKMDDKQERDRVYLRKLLEHILVDVRAILVKLADRLDNMRTLDGIKSGKPEDVKLKAQQKIARQTFNIFIPLARRLGLYNLQDEMFQLCLKYLNPTLLQDWNNYIASSKEKLFENNYWENLRQSVLDSHPDISEVELEPYLLISLIENSNLNKSIEDITFEDLQVRGPIKLKVKVITNTRELPKDIYDALLGTSGPLHTTNSRIRINRAFGRNSGYTLKTYGPQFSQFNGVIHLRINSAHNEQSSQTGRLDGNSLRTPESIRVEIRDFLRAVDETKSDIIEAANETLSPYTRIILFDNGTTRFYELEQATTPRQLYKLHHGIEMPAHLVAIATKSVLNNDWSTTEQEIELDQPVPPAMTIAFLPKI
jgi:hypothetical protein